MIYDHSNCRSITRPIHICPTIKRGCHICCIHHAPIAINCNVVALCTMADEAPSQPPLPAEDPPPAAAEASTSQPYDESLLKEFFSDLRDVDRDNEVQRILWAFKLNPFEKLNIRFTAKPEEIRKAYRKTSLMVHPDKCKHPQAQEAFELLGQAQKELLDEEKHAVLMEVLNRAADTVREERRKETKNDAAIELAAVLHERGREGVEEEWEKTDEFHERWKKAARDVLAKAAFRHRKLTKRLKDETQRLKEAASDARENAKRQKEHEKQWEGNRESRVAGWRDFQKKGGSSKVPGSSGIKPPKAKTNDEDKLYVQRPVGEQFRPAPKPAGPKPEPKA